MTQVTIIMPAYNAGRFIEEAVRSVIAQTHTDWRMQVIDDGSTDDTFECARRVAGDDPRIVVSTGANRGIAHVMNDGIERATTEWVACMHADDVMMPNRLERQLAFATEHTGVAVLSSLVDWIDPGGRVVGRQHSDLTTPELVRRKTDAGGCVAFTHSAVMFRRDVIRQVGGYRQEFFPAEDTELWNRVVTSGYDVLVQPEVLMLYRLHPGSASMRKAAEMIRKLRWMEACIAARRQNQPEPTREQFVADRNAATLGRRFTETRRDWSRILYQAAIGHYAARNFVRLLPCAMGSVLLEPELVLRRLRNRF